MFHIDPVCTKKLRRKQEYAILKYGGNVYHLCCKACKEAFEKHPIQYLPEGRISVGQKEHNGHAK
jgi:YHS domain-containing protein